MRGRNSSHQELKTSVKFPHLIPKRLLESYLTDSMPFNSAIISLDIKFTVLTDEEDSRLWQACMAERYPKEYHMDPNAIDVDFPKIEMKAVRK